MVSALEDLVGRTKVTMDTMYDVALDHDSNTHTYRANMSSAGVDFPLQELVGSLVGVL